MFTLVNASQVVVHICLHQHVDLADVHDSRKFLDKGRIPGEMGHLSSHFAKVSTLEQMPGTSPLARLHFRRGAGGRLLQRMDLDCSSRAYTG